MDTTSMSIKELIREVKRLDKELPMEVWEKAFDGFDSLIWDLSDAIEDWDYTMQDPNPYTNHTDYADMAHRALEQEDYPDEYKEYKDDIDGFFEVVLERLSEVMEDK